MVPKEPSKMSEEKTKISTIKLTSRTKERVSNLKIYKRETYEETIQRLLDIMNLTLRNPIAAKGKLISLEKTRRRNMRK